MLKNNSRNLFNELLMRLPDQIKKQKPENTQQN